MSILKKSRKYEVDGTNYAFDFVGDKLAGIKQDVNGVFNPIPPKGTQFANVSSSDEALNAYKLNVSGNIKMDASGNVDIDGSEIYLN